MLAFCSDCSSIQLAAVYRYLYYCIYNVWAVHQHNSLASTSQTYIEHRQRNVFLETPQISTDTNFQYMKQSHQLFSLVKIIFIYTIKFLNMWMNNITPLDAESRFFQILKTYTQNMMTLLISEYKRQLCHWWENTDPVLASLLLLSPRNPLPRKLKEHLEKCTWDLMIRKVRTFLG